MNIFFFTKLCLIGARRTDVLREYLEYGRRELGRKAVETMMTELD